MHVELEQHVDAIDRKARRLDDSLRLLRLGDHPLVKRGGVDALEAQVHGLHLVMPDIGDDAAERRGHAGIARDERGLEADVLDQRADMQRTTAAEGHGGELGRIMPALDGHEANGACHLGIGDTDDRLGRHHHIEAEGLCHMLIDRGTRGLDVETLQHAADRAVGVDAPEDHIGVGQGRPGVALP
jgi:hypothetical protein